MQTNSFYPVFCLNTPIYMNPIYKSNNPDKLIYEPRTFLGIPHLLQSCTFFIVLLNFPFVITRDLTSHLIRVTIFSSEMIWFPRLMLFLCFQTL
jgi:hypothetical protein